MKATAPRKSLRKFKPTQKVANKKKLAESTSDEDFEFDGLDDLGDQLFAEELEFEEEVGLAKQSNAKSPPKKKAAKSTELKSAEPKVTKSPKKATKSTEPAKTMDNNNTNNNLAASTIIAWNPIQTALLVLLVNGCAGIDVTERGGVSGM